MAPNSQFADHTETIGTVPSHRALALFRGRNEGVLQVVLTLDSELDETAKPVGHNPCEAWIAKHFGIVDKAVRPTSGWPTRCAGHGASRFSAPRNRPHGRLARASEEEAIRVFGSNLHDLLLAAPAGQRTTMGIDPGVRTGCKVAIVDATGKLLDTATIYPHEPRRDWDGSLHTLAMLVEKHGVDLISIGNGTASRETDKLAADLIRQLPDRRPRSLFRKPVRPFTPPPSTPPGSSRNST